MIVTFYAADRRQPPLEPMIEPLSSSQDKLQSFEQSIPDSVVKLPMVAIPGGKLKSAGKEVAIKPFYIAKTETVWELFDLFLASGAPSPSYDQTQFAPDAIARPSKSYILPDLGWGHHGYPVINVSSLTAEMFCRWLSKVTGKKYRLPTEVEWRWAAQGGDANKTKLAEGELDKFSWHEGNCEETTHRVGKKEANAFGLHDMFGNAGEWARSETGEIVLLGGTFKDGAEKQTAAERKKFSPKWQETDPQFPKSRWWLADGSFVGFRVVCEP